MLHLTVALLFAALALAIAGAHFKLSRSWLVLYPTFAVYYWSLHGAIVFAYDEVSGSFSAKYFYLFSVMFPVFLDDAYLTVIGLYGVFLVLFQVLLLWILSPLSIRVVESRVGQFYVERSMLSAIAAVGATIGVLVLYGPAIAAAGYENTGLYSVQRDVLTVANFAAASLLHKSAMLLSLLCLFLPGSPGADSRALLGKLIHASALIVNVAIGAYGGMKAQFVSAFVPALMLFSLLRYRLSLLNILAIGLPTLVAVASLDVLRAYSLDDLLRGDIDPSDIIGLFTNAADSPESVAAHFSLYAIITNDVTAHLGDGLKSLVSSFVPRFLEMERATPLYEIYASQIGLLYTNQGFTLHNLAGWYLEFGGLSVVLSALFLAFTAGLPLRWAAKLNGESELGLVCVVAFCLVAGEYPQFVRGAQIEPLKTFIYQFIISYLLIFCMGLKAVRSEQMPNGTLPHREGIVHG
jgi:hypothetical protein